jgi:hypothetical protein
MKYNDLLNTIKNVHVMTTADLFLTLETIDTVKSNYMGLSDSDKNILNATELLIQNQLKERQNMGVEYETIRI